MVPANIVSGFKKCDVYPFNPDAIAIHTPNVASENGATREPTSGDSDKVLSGMELDKRDSERECVLDLQIRDKHVPIIGHLHYHCDTWLGYDQHFHQTAAILPDMVWAQIDPTL